MTYIGLFDAKQHLSELIERVKKGESIAITKRGVIVARLVPDQAPENRKELAETIRANRKGVRLGSMSLRALIAQGRR